MAAKRRPKFSDAGVKLALEPTAVRQGALIVARGVGWGACPVRLSINGNSGVLWRIAQGAPYAGGVRPEPNGEFVVVISTVERKPRKYKLTARSVHEKRPVTVTADFEVQRRPAPEPRVSKDGNEEVRDSPYWRGLDFFRRRFSHLGFIPPGMREVQIGEIRRLRAAKSPKVTMPPALEPSMPVPGVCNWNPVGPGPVVVDATRSWSGRALSIAIDPTNPAIVYLGTAGGGVWKSTDNATTWSPKTDFNRSLAIGALAIDPNDPLRIFAGTGEYNDVGVGTYYGNGILYSANGGDTWAELGTATFERDEISAILFDPTDATSQQMFLSSSIGVYESPDGGMNWNPLRAGSASALVLIVSGSDVQLIAGFKGSGIWTSTRTAGVWSTWTQYASAAFPAAFARIALGQSRDNPQTIYAAFSDGSSMAGLAKTTNGGSMWTKLTPALLVNINATSGAAGAPSHQHTVTIPAADLDAAPAAHAYVTSSAGMPAHTHTLTLTAANIQTLANGSGTVTKNTDPDATGHQHSFTLDRRDSGQTWYNFHISVHPTNPNIVFYGDIRLWKTTTGDGPWTSVAIQHTDQHAFAYDPVTPSTVLACNDGGVYRSTDTGMTWFHCNRDLQTLEYISISQHPQWETVMIGGTQDNGTQRYIGSPAWRLSAGGDGGFTAIDPAVPTRMYHAYVYNTFYRSDDAGQNWMLKNSGITGQAEFYAPFALDPSDPNTCYFGGDTLWRSPDNANSWAAVTAALNGNITAIAVHPADSTTVHVGTTSGHVYRVQRTGPTWNLADVTTTDLTGADLPAGIYISDLAMDSLGTVWATVASVQWTESSGEFTNDHVFRRESAATTWETRSTGLAQANPINTIVIDPADHNRLFCGGDLSVFRTDDAGGMWTPWDEGLPNVPVFDLQIHNARRLLRAATHGRSVWERPIDAAACPMVDLYMRDNILDSGRILPSPEGFPDPLDPTHNAHHWQSEDIKVDGPEPDFQTPSPVSDYVSFALLEHRFTRRERTNRFYVQVHNRGVSRATNVRVRAFFAAASGGLPALPADFWSGGKPFTGTPAGPDWAPVGPTQVFAVLEPGEPGVAEWDWFVPMSAPQHSCLLALATCDEDPLDGGGLLNPDVLVVNRKHVTLKNLHVEDPIPGGMPMPPEQAMQMQLRSLDRNERFGVIQVEWGSLPRDTRIWVTFETIGDRKPAVAITPAELKALGIVVTARGRRLFPKRVDLGCGHEASLDLARVYQLSPSKDRTTVMPGIRLRPDRPRLMLINVALPKKAGSHRFQFDVIQLSGRRVVGGNTYQLRTR